MEKLDRFRQPMVTATGIFLGFLLEFTSSWTHTAFSKYKFRDIVLAISIILSLAALLWVLLRMLRIRCPIDDVEKYYRRTLFLFFIGMSIPFLGFVITIIDKFVIAFYYTST